MDRQSTAESVVSCCAAAGGQCNCAEIALENSKDLHTLKNIITDVIIQNETIIKWQQQHQPNVPQQETPQQQQVPEANEEIIPLIATKKELDDLQQNLLEVMPKNPVPINPVPLNGVSTP
ncbi:uncharacterized protein LOC121602125 [Anopheles merus]|uniref:uncharacterized protein LOC121602125 n=1 Tax=Anopheles merus TaxID=30066 RepID=UPI001BE48509|nr:uncharacterized protein LOC121602125 [Anopheles merus]